MLNTYGSVSLRIWHADAAAGPAPRLLQPGAVRLPGECLAVEDRDLASPITSPRRKYTLARFRECLSDRRNWLYRRLRCRPAVRGRPQGARPRSNFGKGRTAREVGH